MTSFCCIVNRASSYSTSVLKDVAQAQEQSYLRNNRCELQLMDLVDGFLWDCQLYRVNNIIQVVDVAREYFSLLQFYSKASIEG